MMIWFIFIYSTAKIIVEAIIKPKLVDLSSRTEILFDYYPRPTPTAMLSNVSQTG
jgi:hypothetical protein